MALSCQTVELTAAERHEEGIRWSCGVLVDGNRWSCSVLYRLFHLRFVWRGYLRCLDRETMRSPIQKFPHCFLNSTLHAPPYGGHRGGRLVDRGTGPAGLNDPELSLQMARTNTNK